MVLRKFVRTIPYLRRNLEIGGKILTRVKVTIPIVEPKNIQSSLSMEIFSSGGKYRCNSIWDKCEIYVDTYFHKYVECNLTYNLMCIKIWKLSIYEKIEIWGNLMWVPPMPCRKRYDVEVTCGHQILKWNRHMDNEYMWQHWKGSYVWVAST